MESTKLPYDLVATEMEAVHERISRELGRTQTRLASEISQYTINSGGKRVRPLIVLLIAGACGGVRKAHIEFATIVEFIHTTTILHDDVVDGTKNRRNQQTAHQKWDSTACVLTGDFLYARALTLLHDMGITPIIRNVIDACELLASGELMQLSWRGRADISEEDYFEIVRRKTAVLFQVAAESSALLSQSNSLCKAARNYGLHGGIAFQIADDVLDYSGNMAQTGKRPGTDFLEGKLTLPFIYALRVCDPGERKQMQRYIGEAKAEYLGEVTDWLNKCGAMEYARECAHRHTQKALDALNEFPPSEWRQAMEALLGIIAERNH